MLDLTRNRAGPITTGGPRFLAVFGSVLLLIWGIVALAAGTAIASFGGSGGAGAGIAFVLWIAAIFCMYAAFSEWRYGQLGCAGVSLLTFVIAILLAAAWLVFWAFSGGLIGLAAFLSWRSGRPLAEQPHNASSKPAPGGLAVHPARTCPKCNAEVGESSRFCRHCGTAIAA